jgi:ribosomal 50S subunit-associated protein YjgA (DUF615 family)
MTNENENEDILRILEEQVAEHSARNARIIAAIEEHKQRLIAEGPEACLDYLNKLGFTNIRIQQEQEEDYVPTVTTTQR